MPLVFALYWFVFYKSLRIQNLCLLLASYFFYGWWSYKFLGLLIVGTLLNFTYGSFVGDSNKKRAKRFLIAGVLSNLLILGLFKYYNFFAFEFQHAAVVLGFKTNPVFLQMALPIGISFYTFHGMSYVFDIYYGKQKPVSNIVDYGVFVAFFPLLVAGPIERAHHLLPQVQKPRSFKYESAVQGCRLILWGLFKKVVIADSLAPSINNVFYTYLHLNGVSLILGAIAFAFQIYGDFSGYSDIALGTSKLFGFEVLSNFKFPYFSRDIAEFWRRWHVSLSSWFKDYLYIPLGGSKRSKAITIRNTFIIFIVSGFWHGASWSFIIWGTIHAFAFLPLLLFNKNRTHTNNVVANNNHFPSLKEVIQMLSTFLIVTIAWIFFRMNDLKQSLLYIRQIISSFYKQPQNLFSYVSELNIFYYVIPFILIDWYLRKDERQLKVPANSIFRWSMYVTMVMMILYHLGGNHSFIYFQF
ncbi:MAG: MBOAT family O-acyltransferase [Bacteroidota bacterium]